MPWSPIAGHNQAPIDSEGPNRRHAMNQDNKAHEPYTRESGGLLHHLFGRSGHETPEPGAHSRPGTKTTLDLARSRPRRLHKRPKGLTRN